ncbi:MAG: fluoride efflux transporter CrcB [Actinomycetota bacterium]|nr:fluoride efflux transporter CrcB [Actinomycetota bacterium]
MAAASSGSEPARPVSRPALDAKRRAARLRRMRRQVFLLLAIGMGGALGALSRYAISLALPVTAGQMPWGIFLINISGALALGFLLTLLAEQFPRSRMARPLVGTGFIGAYTTFSTWMTGVVSLARDGAVAAALAYLVLSMVAGVAAVVIGMAAGRTLVRVRREMQQEAS